jgi:tRNA nucleotidyltransferase (CCA-adding enzyme)
MAGVLSNLSDINLPKQVQEVLDKLGEHGYSAYIHGECVRVLLKGQTHLDEIKAFDFDVMTNAEMPRVCAIFDGYNITEDNLEKGELIVTILGVAVSITSFSQLEAELANEHAFTFDAIAYSVKTGIIDPFNGLVDLDKGTLNFIQVGKAFNYHDILPALAWQSSGEFTISDSAKQLIMSNITDMAKPDYAKESQDAKNLKDILMERNVSAVLTEYSDIFAAIIPELKMLNQEQIAHSYKCVGCSSPILTLRYALLFHELGKPDCHSRDSDGADFYYGHAERSRIYASRIMKRLGCPEDDIKEIEYIIENYQKILHADEENILDLTDDFPAALLKLLLLFNCAVYRAFSDEKTAMKYKKLSKGI